MFMQRASPVSGMMEWVCCDEDEDDIKHEIARSTYAGMLHDYERNCKYYEGIKKAVKKVKDTGATVNVLDIGTGSGILAMMAARAGADAVTACEVFKPMAQVATKVVTNNDLSSKVKVVDKRSTELLVGKDKDLPEKVNVLVTEIFDSELIGEGVLPTMRHARKSLLLEGCKIVPSSAKVYIQCAQCQSLWKRHKLSDLKFPNGKPFQTLQSLKNCRGTAAVDELHVDSLGDIKMLSNPNEAIRFDFDGRLEDLNFDNNNKAKRTVEICSSGTFHCLVLWWDLNLDEEGEIILSMAPKISSTDPDKVVWRDHWMQAVYLLPNELKVAKGDRLDVAVNFDDYSFWFDVVKDSSEVSKIERPICTCGFHTVWSRERFSMCNNTEFWNSYCHVLQKLNSRKKAVVLGDVSLLPIFAAQYFEKIVYVEFSQMSKDIVKKLATINKVGDKLDIINIRDINGPEFANAISISEPDAVLAEPFFSTSLLPWEHLTFWYHYSKLSKSFSRPPVRIPSKGILKIVAVQFQDLWKVRKPVENIGEFKLDAFDSVIQDALQPDVADEHGILFEAEPYAIWEYNNEILSNISDCGCFDFNKNVGNEKSMTFEGDIHFDRDGVFHAIVAWIDFYLDEDISWTTGFDVRNCCWVKHSKQGVVFVQNPANFQAGMDVKYRVVFQPESCQLLFQLPGNN